ncbi:MAG: hypothetical protein WCR55_01005 [Lentisphaerota bacterium]
MDISKYKLWTELDWADQFKKEDININAYFEELDKYLDLPDEDELIFSALKKRKLSTDELNIWEDINDFADEDEFDEISESELANRNDSSSIYYEIGEISSDLCRDIAYSDSLNFNATLSFLMLSGRAMSLHLDFIQLGKEDFPELKKAIVKREIFILNSLIGFLVSLEEQIGDEKSESYLLRLHGVREKLIDLRFTL